MVTRIPPTFEGTPTLTEAKVEALKEWLKIAMGDEDKASEIDDATYYEGTANAYCDVLNLLYGTEHRTTTPPTEGVTP